jgi:hypothetical protein
VGGEVPAHEGFAVALKKTEVILLPVCSSPQRNIGLPVIGSGKCSSFFSVRKERHILFRDSLDDNSLRAIMLASLKCTRIRTSFK